MRTLPILAAAMLAIVAVPPANALDYRCELALILDGLGLAYVAIDEIAGSAGKGALYSIWTYLESNGQPGLQRGGVSPLGDPDPCQDSANPDFLVF